MPDLLVVLLVSWFAGLTALLGGFLASTGGSKGSPLTKQLNRGTIAFGGGLLVAAIAFALLPQGMLLLSPWELAGAFITGGLLFALIDMQLSRRGGTRAQFMAMLMDYLPESISMGAVFVHNHRLGLLLAAFIAAQNLPEGFNAHKEITSAGAPSRHALWALFLSSFLGPAAALTGYLFLQNHMVVAALIMTFAGGGILYLIFQDIAPQSHQKNNWVPALGAVLGFTVGMLGKQLLG